MSEGSFDFEFILGEVLETLVWGLSLNISDMGPYIMARIMFLGRLMHSSLLGVSCYP